MKMIPLGASGLNVPAIGVGCMRMNKADKKDLPAFIETCLECGANFFDHADIYGRGECETLFAQAVGMKPSVREKLILQSKCGIVPGVRILKPDFPENRDDYPFLWSENEYVISLAASYVYYVHAVNDVLK